MSDITYYRGLLLGSARSPEFADYFNLRLGCRVGNTGYYVVHYMAGLVQ